MKLKSMQKLKKLESNRNDSTGYMTNEVRISSKNLRKVTVSGAYENHQFDPYIRAAIMEKEEELIKKSF